MKMSFFLKRSPMMSMPGMRPSLRMVRGWMPSATACFTSSATSFIFPFCNFSEMSCKIALMVCSLKVVLIQAMPAACNAARTAPAVPCIQMIMRGTGASRLSIVSKPCPVSETNRTPSAARIYP